MSASTAVASAPAVLSVRSDVSPQAWDAYVARRPEASAYHASGWLGVIERAFGHKTRGLAVCAGDEIVGVLPLVLFGTPLFGRFATSMPFVNYGGIVADSPEAAEALLAAGIDTAQKAGAAYLELRHTAQQFERLPVQTHKVSMMLPLQPTVDDQWRVLDRKLRNQVRKAEKSNLTVRVGGVELLDAFYEVLVHNMRDLGSPVHASRFFSEVLTTFPDASRVFSIWLDGKPIAASLVLWHGDTVEVPWASAIRQYNPLCPNVLLYWEMLKFCVERRFARFDFGRSTPHEGTYNFKAQWGAEPHQLYWEYWLAEGRALPDRSPKNPKFSAVISLWQRLPLAVTRVLGPAIVKNIP